MKAFTIAIFSFAALFALNESAGTMRLMGEQDTSTGIAGNESYIYNYDTNARLLSNT